MEPISRIVYSSLIALIAIVVILIGFTSYYHSQLPNRTNTTFRIVAYTLEGHPSLGHIKLVIECDNTKLQKEYMVKDGKFYFIGYADNKTISGEEGRWVGGISCTPPFYKS